MANFSIEPYFDPIKQWRYYLTNDVAMRLPYDLDDPLFLQKVSVLQAEQVKHMVAGSYSKTAAFRDETNANFAANRQAMEKGMNMLGSRITQVGGMITNSLENGFAAMNYGFTDLSNKAEIANAYLSDINRGMALSNKYSWQLVNATGQLNAGMAISNKYSRQLVQTTGQLNAGVSQLNVGMSQLNTDMALSNLVLQQLLQTTGQLNIGVALSNKYSQQLVQATEQLNEGVTQLNLGVAHVNRNLVGLNNNLFAMNRTLSTGFSILSAQLSVVSNRLDSILEELKIPETQRERRYHIQEGMKYLAQATKDNDDLYFEDALDEFNRAISIESKDYYSHYYAGYIYLFSKEHLDIDKAIDHLRRFIHYAKAALNTASAMSLWNDACFNLSLGYYLQGKLPEAIQIVAMQIGDSEKLLLQQTKYLSLGSDSEKQQAIFVVNKILHNNPYAVMLLLQDTDILMNPYLLDYLDRLRNEAYSKAKLAFKAIMDKKESAGIKEKDDKALLDKYLSQNTYLSAVAAQGYFARLDKVWSCIKCVFVEGGTFWMGAQSTDARDKNYDDEASFSEGPMHSVTLNDFCVGESLVTQAFWKEIMGSNPSIFKGDDLPVENVSWNDCQEFINKLNSMTGKKFRLPTEAEWEYAAKGGRKSKGYKYAGSNSIEEVAWYNDNSSKCPHPVKMKLPNELGLYDMSGMLREWCGDWCGKYCYGPETNPVGPLTGSYRVLRGGSWCTDASRCRASFRDFENPQNSISDGGLRLAFSK